MLSDGSTSTPPVGKSGPGTRSLSSSGAQAGFSTRCDIAEISLALDQRVALREILRQPHQRLVNRELAVRMELADYIADHAGAFLVSRGRIEAELLHRMQYPAVHRLQPVAHIGQRARHDRRQRIGEIALAERVGEVDIADHAGEG